MTTCEPRLSLNTGTCSVLNDIAKSSVVLDRELDEEKSTGPSDPRIRCPLCGWSPRKEEDGVASADTNGTRSILEACAPRAYTYGLRHSASLVATGRHTRIGMRLREK
jgi:hypothetical protein